MVEPTLFDGGIELYLLIKCSELLSFECFIFL